MTPALTYSLTAQQRNAAGAAAQHAYIEAGPGSGKTTVAAARFGVLRYTGKSPEAVIGLSFTRSAVTELRSRIKRRWGSSCLEWPHRVDTLDSFMCEVLSYLLRTEILTWPGGHQDLEVLDTWRGQQGSRRLSSSNQYRRIASLSGNAVVSRGVRIVEPVYGFGTKADFEKQLSAGRCTHSEVRQVLEIVLATPALRAQVRDFVTRAAASLIVDEIFDANELDCDLLSLAIESGLSTTLVGDPWQALYGFRGARPDLAMQVVEASHTRLEVTESFRFDSAETGALAEALRNGEGSDLIHGKAAECDVVLAHWWSDLWGIDPVVLPISVGQIDNHMDAAIVIFLDSLTSKYFGIGAVFAPESAAILGLDLLELRLEGLRSFQTVFSALNEEPSEASTSKAFEALRDVLGNKRGRALGRSRSKKTEQLAKIAFIRDSLHQASLVPGLTIHQAKGREWSRVGVALREADLKRVRGGLSRENAGDRLLYVALTRARVASRLISID